MPLRVAIGPSSFAEQDPAPLRLLEAAGCTVVPNPFGRRLTEAEIIEHLQGVDGLVAGLEPLNRAVLRSTEHLKAIARVGIGVANVDFDAAAECGIAVSSTPQGPIDAVAEMTVAALLAISRGIVSANRALHEGRWEKSVGSGLVNAKVLIVGYGRIGRRFHELIRAFKPVVGVFDPYAEDLETDPELERFPALKQALEWADVVSLHASGTECILDGDAIDAMKSGVVLLNSARGELVDEAALVCALGSGAVRSVWFDAFVSEPYDGPLSGFDQALLTPHIGTYTRQCRLDMELNAVRNLLRDLAAHGLPGLGESS
ncbi:MAG: hydroxyacid dehydrogenase [Candidatus Hydrogenedentes bacterium]|nr:hydroxyacid dehydrogenase [Candidatus Hydrogenedentota bacterium]